MGELHGSGSEVTGLGGELHGSGSDVTGSVGELHGFGSDVTSSVGELHGSGSEVTGSGGELQPRIRIGGRVAELHGAGKLSMAGEVMQPGPTVRKQWPDKGCPPGEPRWHATSYNFLHNWWNTMGKIVAGSHSCILSCRDRQALSAMGVLTQKIRHT